ncbi:MAG: mannose-1-phosphate guanylyltransferase [Bacteroidales bacterium]|nr:MAG: mannose-1-phosphate guanylyltransferase [Bacteroidales bacterium]
MNRDYYCIIMAGGVGSRFWPLSRTNKPKQFLDILGTGKTLLQTTHDRFKAICPSENIYVVTNATYGDIVKEQLPGLSDEQILLEPMRKNTAPCIAYAAFKIQKKNPDAILVVAPSDHFILKEEEFQRTILEGLEFVKDRDALLTLGIQPDRPETGYGYIQINNGNLVTKNPDLKKVKTFTEKPDYELAKVFFESGEFYWNSGLFIGSLESFMKAFKIYLPEMYSLFVEGNDIYNTKSEKEFIFNTYSNAKSISIDYGIMEKAENVYVLCSDFGWSDLGTWSSLFEHSGKDENNNVRPGENILDYDVKNSIIKVPGDKLVVLQGLEDYIVVESDDILLICRRKDEQKIKQFVHDVQIRKGEDYI